MNNRIKTLNEAKEDNNVQKNKEAKEEFIKYIQNERKYSEYTVNNYHKDILEFETFLKENKFGNLLDPINSSGRYYTSHLNEHYHKPRSVARKLSSLRSFYKFCIREGYTTSNPFINVSSPKLDKTLPKFLYEEEIEILFDSIDTSTILGIRDYALLEFMYGTGVRVSELCSIKDTDIDYINHKVIVLGKGGKQRKVYFDSKTKLHLQHYLDSRIDKNDALFVSMFKPFNRLQISGVEIMLRTLATKAIDKGMPVEQVQVLLGHTKIDTTMHYAIVDQTNVKNSYRRYIG